MLAPLRVPKFPTSWASTAAVSHGGQALIASAYSLTQSGVWRHSLRSRGRVLLLVTLALLPDVRDSLDSNVGDDIPRVVDTDKHEHKRGSSDSEQRPLWAARKQDCRDDERCIRDERNGHIPQPVLCNRVIGAIPTAKAPRNDGHVGQPADTSEAEREGDMPERWPWRADEGGEGEHDAKVYAFWRGERPNPPPPTAQRSPRHQGDRHECQSGQRPRGRADDDIEVVPSGKWRHRSLLHDGFPARGERGSRDALRRRHLPMPSALSDPDYTTACALRPLD